ncbi:Bug family tripartite tricarboxylate transporter substrate binding protein [Falsiroseomonas selenitidurans]|uniref:Tripartite tricarboxylate transporter substrate binding protein n=1 Tax=Falsiroseomonas selenitidurans TaxID=2716335 RepID=A0ABX1E4Q7_9PROT|nr:tripartite tricarboxylate transporter substrate binding protein [Falsiroseomonas selenitidurans]NKC30487.1 tripartite tricarboxylate transporter substrate binding protein [Falsiroseomonas selenitidurans]
MRNSRRALLGVALAVPGLARAQEAWPQRPMTLVVPFAPGGPVDNVARPVAEGLRRALGQPVVVENRAGAGGLVGTRMVAAARPDGYTMVVGSPGPLVIAPAAGATDAPDPLRALAPVALIADSPQMLAVTDGLAASDLAGFVALAKARPGALNLGSAGIGTTPHLALELLGQLAGIRLEHVPYRGTGAALPDLIGGKIDALFGDISALLPLVTSGRVRALAITADARSPLAPAIPTTAELGYPALVVRNFQALLAPAGTPAPILTRMAAALAEALRDPQVAAALARIGALPAASGPDHLAAYLRAERETWEPVIRRIGLRLA